MSATAIQEVEAVAVPKLEVLITTEDLADLHTAGRYTLADAIREGSRVVDQSTGAWSHGDDACALLSAHIAVKARHLL